MLIKKAPVNPPSPPPAVSTFGLAPESVAVRTAVRRGVWKNSRDANGMLSLSEVVKRSSLLHRPRRVRVRAESSRPRP